MSEHTKITASHRVRSAVVYVRQSTLAQLERNGESTARQYDLRERAVALGWPREQVRVVDADLGVSGSVLGQRDGFESLVADIALGQVGIVLALEVSRLARDNAAWYRLLDLAGTCDTLVADADGVYHPGLFNDRMLLGMKGRHQHPTRGQKARHRRGEGGLRAAAGPGHLRRLRPQTRRVLPRPGEIGAELLLPRLSRAGRGPWVAAYERRRASHRLRRRRGVPDRGDTGSGAGRSHRR